MQIREEKDLAPANFEFDVVIGAVGFEKRCRWAVGTYDVRARYVSIGLEFGFLAEGSYEDNRLFFKERGFSIMNGLAAGAAVAVRDLIASSVQAGVRLSVFVDISSMSREMIANVIMAIKLCHFATEISISAAYAPSKFAGKYKPAPIRQASPITPELAGWSATAERPVGAIFGLGCEPRLALGALQFLEPNKAWTYSPKGVDSQFEAVMRSANEGLSDIFDVTNFEYDIQHPALVRTRLEVLLNSIDKYFRVIIVPFGPKIFSWISISTVVFEDRSGIGVWAFSAKEEAQLVDRQAEGPVVWHQFSLAT